MERSDLWDALRARGVDADDPEIRATVRTTLDAVEDVRQRLGHHHARRCMEAMHRALAYELEHPDTDDMSRFEDEFEGD